MVNAGLNTEQVDERFVRTRKMGKVECFGEHSALGALA
jgi:hypothetical protein